MKAFTIGYGGRSPQDFLGLLREKAILAVVDVRLRPDRSSMGTYVKAKDPDKGIARLLEDAGIQYFSFVELGNIFMDCDDWKDRYQKLLEQAGDLLIDRLRTIPGPFCLLCAEKQAARRHRLFIAAYLAKKGYEIEHIE